MIVISGKTAKFGMEIKESQKITLLTNHQAYANDLQWIN